MYKPYTTLVGCTSHSSTAPSSRRRRGRHRIATFTFSAFSLIFESEFLSISTLKVTKVNPANWFYSVAKLGTNEIGQSKKSTEKPRNPTPLAPLHQSAFFTVSIFSKLNLLYFFARD